MIQQQFRALGIVQHMLRQFLPILAHNFLLPQDIRDQRLLGFQKEAERFFRYPSIGFVPFKFFPKVVSIDFFCVFVYCGEILIFHRFPEGTDRGAMACRILRQLAEILFAPIREFCSDLEQLLNII